MDLLPLHTRAQKVTWFMECLKLYVSFSSAVVEGDNAEYRSAFQRGKSEQEETVRIHVWDSGQYIHSSDSGRLNDLP